MVQQKINSLKILLNNIKKFYLTVYIICNVYVEKLVSPSHQLVTSSLILMANDLVAMFLFTLIMLLIEREKEFFKSLEFSKSTGYLYFVENTSGITKDLELTTLYVQKKKLENKFH